MLSQEISDKILTIGCEYRHPKGGVAQVLYNYEHYVFPQFKCITNSGGKNKWYKLFKVVSSLLHTYFILIFDKNIQIVHIHTASYNSFKRSAWFVKTAKFFKKKVILHIHGGGFKEYYSTKSQWITSVLNKCDVVITLSESWKLFYHDITSCPHIYIVENIVEFPTLQQVAKDGKIHLLFLGLIAESKGIFDLLEAIVQYRDVLNNKVYLHIGGNGKIDVLKDFIKQYNIQNIVTYEGFVSGEKKIELFNQADVYILPSYAEGLPVSILEAMSYKLPILSTLVGGIPEIVQTNINGILFQPGDKIAMINAIMTLLKNKKLRIEMGKHSYQRIKPFFPNNVEFKLENIYAYLCKENAKSIF